MLIVSCCGSMLLDGLIYELWLDYVELLYTDCLMSRTMI